MFRKEKIAAGFLTAAVAIGTIFGGGQYTALADVLPEYRGVDFTWQEREEGNDEFPVDELGEYEQDGSGTRVRITEKFFYSQSGTVKTYSLKKDGSTYLSENFQVKEFACKDGTDEILIDSKLVEILQRIRDHFQAPVTITSGYRTPSHNAKVGGASKSYHLYGMAADIKVTGYTPREVAAYAESIGVKGVGLYSSWVHVDTRENKYFWNSENSITYQESSFGSAHLMGDVDGDGAVTSADSLKVLQYTVDLVHLDKDQQQYADVNENGTIDALDALKILKMAVHIS